MIKIMQRSHHQIGNKIKEKMIALIVNLNLMMLMIVPLALLKIIKICIQTNI